MGINPSTKYPGRTTPPDADYPYGGGQNETVDGADDGTPLEIATLNDFWGFFQKLLQTAGITPSGNPDTAQLSDYFTALLESGIIGDAAIGGLSQDKITIGSSSWDTGVYELYISPTVIRLLDKTDNTYVDLLARGGIGPAIESLVYRNGTSLRRIFCEIAGHTVEDRAGTVFTLRTTNTGAGHSYPLGPGDIGVENVRKSLFTLPAVSWGGAAGDYFNTSPVNKTLTGIPFSSRVFNAQVFAYDNGLVQRFTIPAYCSFVDSGGDLQVGNMRLHSAADPSTYDLMELVVEYEATAVD
jgi:hypothetical protein